MCKLKKSRLFPSITVSAIVALFLFAFTGNIANAQSQTIATVIALKGTLQVRPTGSATFKKAGAQQTLHSGDVVKTLANSSASLLFSDGTQLRVGPSSQLTITEPEQVKGNTSFFQLVAGEIWARLRPGRAVQTKYANLVVRGTEIELETTDGSSTLVVLEGSVDFFNDLGSVLVQRGQSSVAMPGQAPSVPVTFNNPGLTVEWRLNLDQVRFARDVVSRPVPGAAGEIPPIFGEIQKLILAGQLDQAAAALENLRTNTQGQAADQRALATRLLGEVQLQAGQPDLALTLLSSASQEPNLSPANQSLLLNGLAWAQAETAKFPEALTTARRALQLAPGNAESQLIIGHASLRSGNRPAAAQAWELASTSQLQPAAPLASATPQAQAWLALLAQEANNNSVASEQAAAAVKSGAQSPVAHMAAALVSLSAGDARRASEQAKLAVQLDHNSVAGQLALSQAELASGNYQAAGIAAAKVTALDPSFAEGYYALGLADAARRDYSHAENSFKRAIDLAPGYAPPAAALTRTYIRAGRAGDAFKFVNSWSEGKPENAEVTTAKGEALFRLAKYREALDQYRSGIEKDPNSALAWANYSRVALDANQLREAIQAGIKAVALAPRVAEYHANLGLAYRFSNMEGQATREFRTALSLDPKNALALVQLGQLQRDSFDIITQRNDYITGAQGFLLDPSVSRDLFRGGTSGFLEPVIGDQQGLTGAVRASTDDAALNLYAEGGQFDTNQYVTNSDRQSQYGRLDITGTPAKNTNFLLRGLHVRDDYGVPSSSVNRVAADDRSTDKDTNTSAAVKHEISDGVSLWAGIFHGSTSQRRTNPGLDGSIRVITPPISPFVSSLESEARALTSEVRLDLSGGKVGLPGTWTLGYARPETEVGLYNNLYAPPGLGQPALRGFLDQYVNYRQNLWYAQYTGNLGSKFQLSGQLRHQSTDQSFGQTGQLYAIFPLNRPETNLNYQRWLPSAVVNYQPANRFNLRFQASRRTTESTPSQLAPLDSLVITEPTALPTGYSSPSTNGYLDNFQLDLEHYGSSGALWKAYLFYDSGVDYLYDFSEFSNLWTPNSFRFHERNYLKFNTIRRSGVGLRHERPLSKHLFSATNVTYAHTEATGTIFSTLAGNREIPALFSGNAAPYHPNWLGQTTFSYIASSGDRAILTANYRGRFYQDNQNPSDTTRSIFPATMTFDVMLLRQPSVFNEYFFQVKNMFGAEQVVYNGIRYQPRQYIIGWTRRF